MSWPPKPAGKPASKPAASPAPAPLAAPLADPRSHPLTRTAGEGLVTAGRGQAPTVATFAPLSLRG
jgi:hypothetical protein